MRVALVIAAALAVPALAQGPSGGMGLPAPDAASKAMIRTSKPADGAMLIEAPATFAVTFVQPTTLTGVTVTDDTDTAYPVPAKPVQKDAISAEIALPRLDPGSYRLAWKGMAGTKPVGGTIAFMVH